MHRFLAMGLAAMLVACGSSPSGSASRSAPNTGSTSSASSSPRSAELIVISQQPPISSDGSSSNTIHLVRPDGSEAQSLTLKPGATVLTAAGSRIFVREGSALKALHRDGSVEALGDLGTSDITRFLSSPDARRWLWDSHDGAHNQVHLAGNGLSARTVEDSNDPNRSPEPFSWTPVGAFVERAAMQGIGDREFIIASGQVDELDAQALTTRPISHTDQCGFMDMSKDGIIACLTSADQTWHLNLIAPDGKTQTVDLNRSSFPIAGDAYFSRDGRVLTIAGASTVGNESGPNHYVTDLVTVKDASIRRLADYLRPSPDQTWQTWLEDGSLILWRLDGAAGGPPGVFVVSSSGNTRKISQGGFAIGILKG